MLALAAALLLATGPAHDAQLVDVTAVVPDAILDLRYATPDNFLRRKVYPVARCLLRREVAERLARAAAALRREGYRLRLWDCYRPRRVQWEMWRLYPHPGYVADPRQGSNHNRGAAVDLTLATRDGGEVSMPTPFDTFDRRAHADAEAGIPPEARAHRARLRAAMESAGFRVNPMEWWHFDAPGVTRYPLLDVPLEEVRP